MLAESADLGSDARSPFYTMLASRQCVGGATLSTYDRALETDKYVILSLTTQYVVVVLTGTRKSKVGTPPFLLRPRQGGGIL